MQEFFESQEAQALEENLEEYVEPIPLTNDNNFTQDNNNDNNLNESYAYSESTSILKTSKH